MRRQVAGRILTRARVSRPQVPALVRAAAGTGLAAFACVAALLSPALSVRRVAWTGPIQVPRSHCQAVEEACLGRPLYLLPERQVRAGLGIDPETAVVDWVRHAPGLLEVRVTPRRAVAVTEGGIVVDRHGRALDRKHALPGLLSIRGFALADDRTALDPDAARLLERVLQGLERAGIPSARVDRRGDDLHVTLVASDTRLVLSARALDTSLRKLALLRPLLATATLPPRVDLRFRDQIVIDTRRSEARRGRG